VVDDEDFEPAVRASGGDIVLLDEGTNHSALDLVLAARDMPHPRFPGSPAGGTLKCAGEGVFVPVFVDAGRDAISLRVHFVGHCLSANPAAFRFGQRTAISEDAFPASHLGVPDVVGDVGKFLPIEDEYGDV
jgi:hypothetical protein